jgi:hypothetical protein
MAFNIITPASLFYSGPDATSELLSITGTKPPLTIASSQLKLVNSLGLEITTVDDDPLAASNSSQAIPTQKAMVSYVTAHSGESTLTFSMPMIRLADNVSLLNNDGDLVKTVSTDQDLLPALDDIIPTQLAVRQYIADHLPSFSTVQFPLEVLGASLQLTNNIGERIESVSGDITLGGATPSNIIIPTQLACRVAIDAASPISVSALPLDIYQGVIRLLNMDNGIISTIITNMSFGSPIYSNLYIPTQKAVKDFVDASHPITGVYEPLIVTNKALYLTNSSGSMVTSVDTDLLLTANSQTRIPTQAAVRAYASSNQSVNTASMPIVISSKDLRLMNSIGTQVTSISADNTLGGMTPSHSAIPTQTAVSYFVANYAPVTAASLPVRIDATTVKLVNSQGTPVSHIDVDQTLSANSDTRLSTQAAIRTYVYSKINFEYLIAPFDVTLNPDSTRNLILRNSSNSVITSIDTDLLLTANSQTRIPTQAAVRAYASSNQSVNTASMPLVISSKDLRLMNSIGTQVTSISADQTLGGMTPSHSAIPTQTAVSYFVANYAPVTAASLPVRIDATTVKLVNSQGTPVSHIDVDQTLSANSDTRLSTQAAIKTYVYSKINFEYLINPFDVTLNPDSTRNLVLLNSGGNPVTAVDTDLTLAANSSTRIATQAATRAYANSLQVVSSVSTPLALSSKDLRLVNGLGGQVTSISTDGNLANNSNSTLPTQAAVKTYVDDRYTVASVSSPLSLNSKDLRLVNNLGAQMISISTDATLSSNSNTIIPTQAAVKAYVGAAGLTFNTPLYAIGSQVYVQEASATLPGVLSAGPQILGGTKTLADTTEGSYGAGSLVLAGGASIAKSLFVGTKVQSPQLTLTNGASSNSITCTASNDLVLSVPRKRYFNLLPNLMANPGQDAPVRQQIATTDMYAWRFNRDKIRFLTGSFSLPADRVIGANLDFYIRIASMTAEPVAAAVWTFRLLEAPVGGTLGVGTQYGRTSQFDVPGTAWTVAEADFLPLTIVNEASESIFVALHRNPPATGDNYDGDVLLVGFGFTYSLATVVGTATGR